MARCDCRSASRTPPGMLGNPLQRKPPMNVSTSEKSRMAVLDVIASRRSVRRYLPTSLNREIVEELLRATAWAPSPHNRQPWLFAPIAASAPKERLARAMGARLSADRLADGDDPAAITRDVKRSFVRITSAPLVILVC